MSGSYPMNEKQKSELGQFCGYLFEVAEQTVERLGEETARRFFVLSSDWVDIQNDALLEAYSPEQLNTSLLYLDFLGLFKELRWLQLLLYFGNYALIYRTLRFDWELIFRGLFADMHQVLFPGRQDGPGDDKAAWLEDRETKLGWNEVMQPVLQWLLPRPEHSDIEKRYRPLWRKLHKFVHGSTEIRERMIDESNLLLVDNYDDQWARESIQDGTEVFDLIWLAVLSRFSKCVPLLKNPLTCQYCPRARRLLEKGAR
jgi:hypothetical protein